MPQRSKAAQLQPRLTPPKHLPDREATVFRSITGTLDPQFFTAADTPLLVEYCRCVALADDAAAAIAESGAVVDGKASPWVLVAEKAQRGMVALAARLRICPQSRFDRLKAGTHARDQVFERVRDPNDKLSKYLTPDPPKPSALDYFRR